MIWSVWNQINSRELREGGQLRRVPKFFFADSGSLRIERLQRLSGPISDLRDEEAMAGSDCAPHRVKAATDGHAYLFRWYAGYKSKALVVALRTNNFRT